MTIIAGVDRGFVPEQKLFPTDNGNEFSEKAERFHGAWPIG
jgi:hypothetical protein